MSLLQTLVLLMFNEGDGFSFEDIKMATGIGRDASVARAASGKGTWRRGPCWLHPRSRLPGVLTCALSPTQRAASCGGRCSPWPAGGRAC